MHRWICIAFFIIQLDVLGQSTWEEELRIPQKVQNVVLDQLNNIYLVKKGQVIKFDASGKELSRYSNKLIGENIQLDASNPMKILMFSSEQMRIEFLDSRLGEIQPGLDLYKEGLDQISLAATSHSNGFWLYDPIQFLLIRFDQNMTEVRRSFNLAQLFKVKFLPIHMLEFSNKLYMCDPENGIYVFDVLANYIKRIPILGIEQLCISDNRIFYRDQEGLKAFNLQSQEIEQVKFSILEYENFDINRNRIAVLKNREIIIYRARP